MKNSKKLIAIIVPIILACLIALSIVLIVVLSKDNNNPNNNTTDTTDTGTDNGSGSGTGTGTGSGEEIVFDAHSNVKFSASKTELVAGDEVTISLEIFTTRENVKWSSVDIFLVPLNVEGKKADGTVSANFEYVKNSATTNMQSYVDSGELMFFAVDKFTNSSTKGMHICFAEGLEGNGISAENKITVSFKMKVKDTATAVESFNFGIARTNYSKIVYDDKNGETITDKFTNDGDIKFSAIKMSIKAN